MKRFFCTSLALISTLALSGQTYVGLGADLGAFVRGGEWSQRYGRANSASSRLELGLSGDWIAGVRAEILFGNDVSIDPLVGLRTTQGDILGDVAEGAGPANVTLRSRGYRGVVYLGYRKSLAEASGWYLRATAGPSYGVHFIRIQDDPELPTNSLTDEYKQGYDRRAGGFGGAFELGPEYVNPAGSLRLYLIASGDVMRSRALNSVQFDTGTSQPDAGSDTAFGVRVGFILGLVRSGADRADDIYY